MRLIETSALTEALKSLSAVKDGEHVYWLGFRVQNGYASVVHAEPVKVTPNPSPGRAGVLVDEADDKRIIALLRNENLKLASLHNHPACTKVQSLKGYYAQPFKLSEDADVVRFDYFWKEIQCEAHFVLEQWSQPTDDSIKSPVLQERSSTWTGVKIIAFNFNAHRCELGLFERIQRPNNLPCWETVDLNLELKK